MKRKIFSILFALVLVLSLSLVTAVPAGAATISVPGNYSTIQAAIDAATAGDTITVAAGTYVEAVLILGKPLTLEGEPGAIIKPDENTPKYDCYKGREIDSDRRAGIYIYQVDGVIIDGFEIDGTGTDVHYGIIGKYSDGSIVRKCVVHDIVNEIDPPVSDVAGVGIMFYNEAKAEWPGGAHGILIEDNVVYKTGRMGIFLGGWTDVSPYWLLSSNNVIEDNEVYDTWQGPTKGSGGALTILGASGSLIQRNEIYNNTGLDQSGISILGLASDPNRIIENDIYNNYVGVKISAGAPELHYNNITGNTYGVQNTGLDMVDARYNWWDNASGPQPDGAVYESYGDKISTNVDYEPWLLKKVIPEEEPTIYNKTLALKKGWTLISTDKAVADSAWVGKELAYTYTPGGGYTEATPNDLEPVDALYVKTDGGGVGINYSAAQPGASSKDLEAGWNLISSATEAAAYPVLSPLRHVQIGQQQGVGLTTLVSQVSYNQFSESLYLATLTEGDWEILAEKTLYPFDGYWIYMNAAKSFGVIPD